MEVAATAALVITDLKEMRIGRVVVLVENQLSPLYIPEWRLNHFIKPGELNSRFFVQLCLILTVREELVVRADPDEWVLVT